MSFPKPWSGPEYTDEELLHEALNRGLDGAFQNASDENRMWYWIGYAAGVTDRENITEEAVERNQ